MLVRVAAAEILGEVGSSADVSRLVHALRSADWLVRAHAADSLGALGYKRARPALVRTVTEDPQPIVRRDAAAALGQQGDQAVVPILERLLADEKEEQARLGLLEALYCLGQRERLPSLLSLFQSNDDTLRHAVLNSVEATVMPEDAPLAVQAIREFLEDEDNPGVRADAERVLSELLRPACNESEHSRLG